MIHANFFIALVLAANAICDEADRKPRIRQLDELPRVPLFKRIGNALKYELELLRHYKYARYKSGFKRLF